MTLEQIAQLLELPTPSFACASFEQAQDELKQFKVQAAKQRKKLALRYHVNGHFDKKMHEINNAASLAAKLILQRRQPQLMMYFNFSGCSATTTASYSSTGEWNW